MRVGAIGRAAAGGIIALGLHLPAPAWGQVPERALPATPAGLPPERVVVVPLPRARPADRPTPFQMGFELGHVIGETGDLGHPGQSASAAGLHFILLEGYAVRQHLGFAHQWEKQGEVTRRGFRLDLLAFGFPIPVLDREVQLTVEPVLRVLRGEVLFQSEANGTSHSLLRLQSGFALALVAEYRRWFVSVEPLSVDFRYLQMTRDETTSGFARLWSLAAVVGRRF